MRILIVGAGVAGLTLAALLRQRGIVPMVIDKSSDITQTKHMLSVYPLGSRILYGLGMMDEFVSRTVPSDNYAMCTGNGTVIHQFSLVKTFEPYGPNRSCTRGTLIKLLLETCQDIPIHLSTEVNSITQNDDKTVHVELNDGTQLECDLVVGADGVQSQVRSLILSPEEFSFYETGWGGWVWWTDDSRLQAGTAMEFWGSGNMLGIYPTEYKFGAFAIAPTIKEKTTPYQGLRSDIRQSFSDLITPYPMIFEQIPHDYEEGMVYWPLSDVRSSTWYKKRVVLMGDAAVGFLPTGDVGVSMAMESAAVLADEISRTDVQHLDWALLLYQRRRMPRVIAAQDDSRDLAKHMFVKSTISSHLRNYQLRQFSLQALSESIDKTFQTPI